MNLSPRLAPLKKLIFAALFVFLLLVVPFPILEALYRAQWIDTYATELRAFNPPEALNQASTRETILILGDSFTAGLASYPNFLSASRPGFRIINSGVSGTGIEQALILAGRRLAAFQPRICIYQLFVGNELFDIRYPAGGERSLARKFYWCLANHFRFVSFVNYRLGQLRRRPGPEQYRSLDLKIPPEAGESFNPDQYDAREKLYLKAEPGLLEDQILVAGNRRADYARLLDRLDRLQSLCRARRSSLYLLVLPHACQVSERYLDRMIRLGARFQSPERIGADDYPFLQGLRARFEDRPAVEIVDPLPGLRKEEAEGRAVYYANDGHLNSRGQRLVSDTLAQVLPTGP